MSIAVTEEHRELAASFSRWAESLHGIDAARAAETDAEARFEEVRTQVAELGLPTIAVAESAGGGGGTLLDLAVAIEAAASRLVPGPLLGQTIAAHVLDRDEAALAAVLADGVQVGVGLEPSLEYADGRLAGRVRGVIDAPGADLFLLGAREGGWYLLRAEDVEVQAGVGPDLTRRFGTVTVAGTLSGEVVDPVAGVDTARVRDLALTLAAAEAAGVARWCLDTAVEYAGIREQFGKKIGSFQAIKHLCAEMLEHAESVTAVAWDAAAAAAGEPEQWEYASAVAGVVALDGALAVARSCIQVLGGIGFTFEHEAHFYLRRVAALRAWVGASETHAVRLAELAVAGRRRAVDVDFEGADQEIRPAIASRVAEIAAAPDRRGALVDSGYLMPHWPEPYGVAASPLEQLVIDQELAAAAVERPDLKIAAWALPTILTHGTDAQREAYLDPTLRGELTWCQLFSEPGAGSDLASLRTRAVRVEGGWELTGQKVWTSLAREADWGICLARTTPDAPAHKGIGYFLIDMSSPGLDVRPLREMTGDELFNEVFLEKVFVPEDRLVGEVDGGWALARTTLANERVAMAGTRLGASTEWAVRLSAAAEPNTRAAVGRSVALATVCALLGTRTTLRSLAGEGPGAESSVAKMLTVKNRQEASDLVVELLGVDALAGDPEADAAIHEMLLTRCLSIAGGTTQVLRNVAAERILGLPRG